MRISLKTLVAAALLFGSAAALQPSPVAAETDRDYYFDRYRSARPYHGGYYRGPAYRSAYYGRRPYYARRGYYRPAYYGYRRYGGRPYRYYYRRGYDGGAAAVGLIGGLALGTIAGAVTGPFYYGPRYYRLAYYAPRCVLERRRVINRYGRRVWRRVEVCY